MTQNRGKLKAQPRSVVVNAVASTVVVDFAKFTVPRGALPVVPPIDEYYSRITDLVRNAAAPESSDQSRRLLVVELVASVESYIRTLLVTLVATCPSSQRVVERKQVTLAAVRYYDPREIAFAVLDHQALSGQSEIVRATHQMLGIEVKPGSSAHVALAGFEKVCQLRHAIVHQGGRLAPNNLLEIGVTAAAPLVVTIDAFGFQDLVALCHTAVRAYNQYVFESVLERWAKEGNVIGEWIKDRALFERLCMLFVSGVDNPNLVLADEYNKLWGSSPT